MDLHEYQGKALLKSFGVKIQEGILCHTPEEVFAAANTLRQERNSEGCVVKAQVHAGGRGKGGGVKFAPTPEKAREKATDILGMMLITPQTSAQGKLVRKVLVTEDVYYKGANEPKEFYISVLMDRSKKCNVIIYSTEGGMDIEKVAEETPHLLHKEWIDPTLGLLPFQVNKFASTWV